MSEDSMLMCLIAFVLGYLVHRMMRGNGLSVGGGAVLSQLIDFDDFKPCIHKITESDCNSPIMNARCFWNNDQKCYADSTSCEMLEGQLKKSLVPVRQLRRNIRRYCAPE